MERYVDSIEKRWVRDDGKIVYATIGVRYCGQVDFRTLKEAFHLLCSKYPVLCGEVVRERRGDVLRVSEGDRAEIVRVDGGLDVVISLLSNDGKDGEFDVSNVSKFSNSKMSCLFFAPEEIQGHLFLSINHILIGGANGMFYLAELWQIYTSIMTGCHVSIPDVGRLPKAPTEILKERWLWPVRVQERGVASVPRIIGERTGVEVTLDPQKSSRLIEKARSLGVSFNSLLFGEVTAAIQEYEPSDSGEVTCSAAVDLFGKVSPPVLFSETTYFAGEITVTIPADTDPVRNALEIKKEWDLAIANRLISISGYNYLPNAKGPDISWNGYLPSGSPSLVTPEGVNIREIIPLGTKMYLLGRAADRDIFDSPKIFGICYSYQGVSNILLSCEVGRKYIVSEIASRILSCVE